MPEIDSSIALSNHALGIRETRELLSSGDISVTAHVNSILGDIADAGRTLGAFVAVASEGALRAAETADRAIRAQGAAAWHGRPLLGVTVAVKDLIQTAELPTTRGSLLPNPRPQTDAPAVARLRAAGAIVIGKTTTSEGGWSASTVSRAAPPTRNPWDLELSAGGSSGGSAAAVAAGLCSVALGTDGAGSIRIPAAFCGVVGFKPSFALVPYVPVCADRVSHLGPLTRTVADAAELMRVMRGPHRDDPDSLLAPVGPAAGVGTRRIGWLEFPGTAPEIRAATERIQPVLRDLGYEVCPIPVPFDDPYESLVDILAAAEAAGTAPGDEPWCDPGRLAVVRHGRTVTGAALLRAEQTRLRLRSTMAEVMERYHLLAMATVPIGPFGHTAIGPDWAADPARLAWLSWAPALYPFNLTGQPAVSLPAGMTPGGLPVAVQLVGDVGGDFALLAAAAEIEARLEPLRPVPHRVIERTA